MKIDFDHAVTVQLDNNGSTLLVLVDSKDRVLTAAPFANEEDAARAAGLIDSLLSHDGKPIAKSVDAFLDTLQLLFAGAVAAENNSGTVH